MEETLIANASAYAARHGLQLAERLGFGIHGIIFAAENKRAGGLTAIKAHRESAIVRAGPQTQERIRVARIL